MATSIRVGPQFQAATAAIINKTYTAWAAEKRKQIAIIAALLQKVIETLQGVTANQQHGSMMAACGSDQQGKWLCQLSRPGEPDPLR